MSYSYRLHGCRYLRKYTASEKSSCYSYMNDVKKITNLLCTVPWTRVTRDIQATSTIHSEEGLDWNEPERERFDAAEWCANHVDGFHRAFANAACYVFKLPSSAIGKNIERVRVNVSSDPYNPYGARISCMTSNTLDIPMDCATVRTGEMFRAPDEDGLGAAPRLYVENETTGNQTWYANSELVSMTPPVGGSPITAKQFLFVFVVLENYNRGRDGWIEGSSYIENDVEITLTTACADLSEGTVSPLSGEVNDLSAVVDPVEFVVCKDGVVPDVSDESSSVISVNVLASGTQPIQDETTKYVTNIAQVQDEISPTNSNMGISTAYAVLAAGGATVADPALSNVNLKRIGAGFCVRQNTDIKLRASAEASPLSPRSIALTASSLCIPFSVPAGLKPNKISFDWSRMNKTWTSLTGIAAESVMKDVSGGHGRFVAIGLNGNSYALANGALTWTALTGLIGNMFHVSYGNGRFVSVGTSGASCALADGATTWTSLTGVSSASLYGISYGNGRFVAVGYRGASCALADGATTWTALTGVSSESLNDISYGNGRFVALDGNGDSYALADGATTWTSLTRVSSVLLNDISYGNGRFVAVGQNGDSYALADGATTWTALNGVSSAPLYGISYGNGRFVAVGLNGNSYALADGATTWTALTGVSSEALYDISYGDGRFVVLGDYIYSYALADFEENTKFNFWIRSGYQDGYAEIPLSNPSLYYADSDSVGDWKLIGSVYGISSSASFDLPFELGKTASVLVTAFVAPENVTPTTNSFSTGAGNFYYNAISADADVTSGSSVVRMFGADSLMMPDVKLIG